MVDFNIDNGDSDTFTDTTPGGGLVIDFSRLDNGFNVQVNGVDLFVGGPGTAPNELEFQTNATQGQTVRFADGDVYGIDTDQVWQMGSVPGPPLVRLEINPDGTIQLFGAKFTGGPLEPLELFNGLTVNTAAIAAAWNDPGTNDITIGQSVTGRTWADGTFVDVPCFAAGTLIATQDGPVPVEGLQPSDRVLTYDRGYQPVRWVGACPVSADLLAAQPRLKPIMIRADALGAGFPRYDLIVSPQHRMLVSSAIAMRMFDCKDVLIPAKKLLSLDGIDVVEDAPDGVTYVHVLFDRHEIIWANGAPSESLFTGPEALKAVSPAARQEINSLFPQCCDPQFAATSARFIPQKGKLMRKLAARHQANGKPLYDGHAPADASL